MVQLGPQDKKKTGLELADSVGLKTDVLECINEIIKQRKDGIPKEFAIEELFFMIENGLNAAGLYSEDLKIRTVNQMIMAYLHGYLIGLALKP